MNDASRDSMRQQYVEAWRKAQAGEALEPLQQVIATIVAMHPEYHAFLSSDDAVGYEFSVESGQSNPFLHMGLHIALHEQLSTDRPAGFRQAYQAIVARHGDVHEAEHQIMECLGKSLWQAQRSGQMPDEAAYLECVQKLV